MTPAEIQQALQERFGDAIVQFTEPQAGDAYVGVRADVLHQVCRLLRDEGDFSFDFLRLVSGVDWGDKLSSVYHLYSYKHLHGVVLRVDLHREGPRVASVCDIWPAADWLERECFDLLGIIYEGHPELKRILLPLDWEGHPLRKDYAFPAEYHGIKHESAKDNGSR